MNSRKKEATSRLMDPISDPIHADELTLDELAIRLAPAVADAAIFDGWSEEAVTNAAEMEGVDPKVARLAYWNKNEIIFLPNRLLILNRVKKLK